MRRIALVLATLLAPAVAAADGQVAVQLSLRNLVADFQRLAPAAPDLTILTTEPVVRSESSGYGWREDPKTKRQKFHHGSDYRGKPGTPVLAAGNGVVVFAGRRGGYGNVVFVDHGGGVITRYAHMRRIETKLGALLNAGDRIGQVGSTGRTTGPHLHFEVRLEGRSVDPNTALAVAEIMRESPVAGQLAAYALAPELQASSRDMQDAKNQRAARAAAEGRPERVNAPKRDRVLW